ncbi:hypothetical protein SAMN05216270_1264 [Glycomyces harbinensis]|uniref:Uncharacterized protein n=2 Tax=Glycomyces harbinensis TaxID=58114 RepID=A0A1G7DK96_9ACTN|nr:hypothetical protein [Glycomyces harbinensis]SDE51903.1 hypothetical protein SAMN05216270_1264 [Glycomyces harbinensis]
MRPHPASKSPTYRRQGSTAVSTALSALLAVFLLAAATACALTVDDADIVGTFEERDGDATLALASDGTGALNGYYSDYPELPGSWSRRLDAIEFVSDMGLTTIHISSADELWIPTDLDRGERREFERTSDEAEVAESPAESTGAEEPGAPCTELSALLDAAEGLASGMEADFGSDVPGEQVQFNASDLTLFGLRVEALVPEDIAAHARALADAGSAITEAIENGGTLSEIMIVWIAPEVIEAEAAVQVYHDGESGCVP